MAWGGAYDNNIKMTQKVQNRILKITSKNKFKENIAMNLGSFLFQNHCYTIITP